MLTGSALSAGTVLGARYVLEALVGQGGMGRVYRARDRESGLPVAVKVMLSPAAEPTEAARFAREIEVLSELAHPGIVAYVGHGATEDGLPFLVMDLLEGEELGARVAAGPLSLGETLLLLRRASEALREAHRRGVIHRDLKPSNLFLRDRAIDRVAILDFGVAGRVGGRALTATGGMVGTPEYMSPEHVRGAHAVGPPADVFSLGCVAYECLAGRPPFRAAHAVATLAMILFDEPPPIARLRPEVPEGVRALLARMLHKDPERRFRDAGQLLDELEALGAPAAAVPAAPPAPLGLGGDELTLVTVILATPPPTLPTDTTVEKGPGPGPAAEAARELARRGLSVAQLADGSIVATLGESSESAVNQAVEAATCARLLSARWPEATIAISTTRRRAGGPPLGEALAKTRDEPSPRHQPTEGEVSVPRTPEASRPTGRIVLDETTAGLLEGRMRLVRTGRGQAGLPDNPAMLDETRLLLGKPTPCLGREPELGTLEATLQSSFDEESSRAVLVVAPPGLGKSRLRHELLRRTERRAEGAPVLRIDGRGERMRAGSPYGLLAQALRRTFRVDHAGGAEAARAQVLAGVARHLPSPAALGVAEMLGELCDAPFPDDESVRLRAARRDPRVLQASVGDALLSLLRGASSTGGVLLVLEDLHWGDRASLDLVGRALRELSDRPLLVVAFARPEIHETFPGLWKGRVVELPLLPLARRACERLVEKVAGDRLGAPQIARIVARSAGNALFLEELVRAACEGDGEALPETVMVMLQARIGRLPPAQRRLLRAASILGEGFDAAAISAVLGPTVLPEEAARELAELAREELVEPQREASPAGGAFRFRHGLMRDAAYALLTDDDRRLGHRLAAAWLSGREHDPAVIAEHCFQAGDLGEAVPWFVRAAERAADRDDFGAIEPLVRRGRASGASGAALGTLASLQAIPASMRLDWEGVRLHTDEALALADPGGIAYFRAVRVRGLAAAYHAEPEAFQRLAERLLTGAPLPEATAAFADSALHFASHAIQTGLTDLGRTLLQEAEQAMGGDLPRYPAVRAWVNMIRCTLLRHTDDDLATQIALLRESLRLYEETGAAPMLRVLGRDVLGEVLCRAGVGGEGEEMLRGAHADALRFGQGWPLSHARLALANGLVSLARPELLDEAERLAREILATPAITDGFQAMARDVLCQVWSARGDLAAAEDEARRAIALSPHTPVRRWLMTAHLAEVLVRAGRAREAHAAASAAVDEMTRAGSGGYAERALLVAAAEAATGAGDDDGARALAGRARAGMDRQAAAFPEGPARARFLTSTEIAARALARVEAQAGAAP